MKNKNPLQRIDEYNYFIRLELKKGKPLWKSIDKWCFKIDREIRILERVGCSAKNNGA